MGIINHQLAFIVTCYNVKYNTIFGLFVILQLTCDLQQQRWGTDDRCTTLQKYLNYTLVVTQQMNVMVTS